MKQMIIGIKYMMLAAFLAMLMNSCKKDNENPFDALEHPVHAVAADTTGRSSITGLQKNIFSVKCAIPSCHGGTFEPDCRTVESSYQTLVYQAVKKNTKKEDFDYRVIPFDTANSWLHYRITHHDSLIMRMPLYANPLTTQEVNDINTWILNGAPDVYGVIAEKPNENPKIYGYGAYNDADVRIDNNRVDWSQPFTAPANEQIKILMYVEDDRTDTRKLEGNLLKFSLDQDDFSNAVTVTADYKNGPTYWGWVSKFNTGLFPSGSHVYMRYYVKDPDHATYAERPMQHNYSYTKNYYSFTIN